MFHGLSRQLTATQIPAFQKTPPISPNGKRQICKAIENNYDMKRLTERIKTPEVFKEYGADGSTPLHYLAGAKSCFGLPIPLRSNPPKEFISFMLKHYPKEQLNACNLEGKTALSIAARTGYLEVVKKLIEKKVGGGSTNPIFEAILSTVYFDPSFRIPNLLISNGYSINTTDTPNTLLKTNTMGPLSTLVDSVRIEIERASHSSNPLYNDLNRIEKFHFNFLPEKAEWLCQQSLENKRDCHQAIDICLSMMEPYANHEIKNRALRPVVPILARNIQPDQKNHGDWSLLHKLVFYQCDEAVSLLLKKNIQVDIKDRNGLTPFDLAALNFNFSLMEKLESRSEWKFSQLTPDFFGLTIKKLPEQYQKGLIPHPYYSFTTGCPRLCTISRNKAENLFLSNYLHDPHGLKMTPMAKALKNRDIFAVEELLKNGWTIPIEKDLIEHLKKNEFKEFKGAEDFLYDCIENWENGFLMLVDAAHSGVSLSKVFDKALRELGHKSSERIILNLFHLGLDPDTYIDSKGKSLNKVLEDSYLKIHLGNSDFINTPGYKELVVIIREMEKRGWR